MKHTTTIMWKVLGLAAAGLYVSMRNVYFRIREGFNIVDQEIESFRNTRVFIEKFLGNTDRIEAHWEKTHDFAILCGPGDKRVAFYGFLRTFRTGRGEVFQMDARTQAGVEKFESVTLY